MPWQVSRTAVDTRAVYTRSIGVPRDHEAVALDATVVLVGEVLGEDAVAGGVGADLGEGDGVVGLDAVDERALSSWRAQPETGSRRISPARRRRMASRPRIAGCAGGLRLLTSSRVASSA